MMRLKSLLRKMINFNKATFIKSSPDITYRPEKKLDEVLFVGKSNVGKSSLINALTNHKSLAYVSSKPGQKVDISGGQSEWMKPFDSFEI